MAMSNFDSEVYVLNTFIQVGKRLSMHNSFSEPGVYGTEPEMVPWKTYDSYDEDFVAKVSTLDYFEQVSSYPAPLDDELNTVQYVDAPETELPVETVSTFDPFDDMPLPQLSVEKLSTFDSFENAPVTRWPLAPIHVPLPETKLMNWKVDGKKLESQEKQMLSPEFNLELPGGGVPFRVMILAKETRGKGCRGFCKAKGRGRLFIKCAGAPNRRLAFSITIGNKSKVVGPHDFTEDCCCPMQEGKEDWDLLSLLDHCKKLEIKVSLL